MWLQSQEANIANKLFIIDCRCWAEIMEDDDNKESCIYTSRALDATMDEIDRPSCGSTADFDEDRSTYYDPAKSESDDDASSDNDDNSDDDDDESTIKVIIGGPDDYSKSSTDDDEDDEQAILEHMTPAEQLVYHREKLISKNFGLTHTLIQPPDIALACGPDRMCRKATAVDEPGSRVRGLPGPSRLCFEWQPFEGDAEQERLFETLSVLERGLARRNRHRSRLDEIQHV